MQINGKWRSELVRDPGVIASYVRHRQRLQAAQGAAEDLVPTGDATMDALAKERLAHEIAAATRNQERREQRRRQKAAAEGKPVGEKGMKSETKVSVNENRRSLSKIHRSKTEFLSSF